MVHSAHRAGELTALSSEWIVDAHRKHVITSWSTQGNVDPMHVVGGEGCWFWDQEGNRYLDFESQLVNLNLGHQHPRLIEAIKEQADVLCYISPSVANGARSLLGAKLAEVTPGNLVASFFTSGGAEANENAVRLARHYTKRQKIITRYRSYHGATAGALSLSGDPRRWGGEPGIPGVVRILDPYTYRCPANHPEPCPVCSGAPHLEEILTYEDPDSVAAVLLETVVGTNGIIYPPEGYLQSIRGVCDKYGILLILDEVMVGFGRTGRWFAFEHYGIVPDILCVAKGLNSGYVPLGAMVVSSPIRDWLDEHRYPGGLTYSGHPLACAVAVASIDIMQELNLVEHVEAMGRVLNDGLMELWDRHISVGDVRGRGLFFGIELVRDRDSRTPYVPFAAEGAANNPMKDLILCARKRGLFLSSYSNLIRLAPPLIIQEDEIRYGLEILDEVLILADEEVRV